MKVWTVSTDTDGDGAATAVHVSEEPARAQFARMVAACWESWKADKPWPGDASVAYQALCDTVGFMDTITVQEHDISSHPAIALAILAVDKIAHLGDDEGAFCNDRTMDYIEAGQLAVRSAFGMSCLTQVLADDGQTTTLANAYRAAAKEKHREGELEIDDKATVGTSDFPGEDGAYVQAWLWVTDEDAGIHNCDDCGEAYVEGDDSYCGQCPDCADKAAAEDDDE